MPLVAIGVITGAHGIKGQVKLRSFTTNPHDLTAYGALLNADGTRRYELKIAFDVKGGIVANIKGVNDRNAAELMRGTELFIESSRLPAAQEEEFYYNDLIGLAVRDGNGHPLGTVLALYDFGAGDIIEIRLDSTGRKEMYPFTKESFPHVSVSEGFITASLPDIIDAGEKTNG